MQKPISSHTKTSDFSKDVLTLVSGTTISILITIFAAPIITRLYNPEDFGLAALFVSITSILVIVSCLRYEYAILLPKSDEEAANLLGLCLLIVVCFSLATIPFLILFQQPLLQLLKAPKLSSFFWLIPPTLLVSGAFLALNFWNTRTKQFYRLSIARVASQFSTTGTQIGIGFLGQASGSALIYTNIFGHIVSAFILGIQILRDHFVFFKQNIRQKRIIEVLKRYKKFPKFDTWSALLNSLSWQIPILLFSYFFSLEVIGYYSLSMMIIQFPMNFIGSSIAQVFFQRAVNAKNENVLHILVENLFRFLLTIGLFPILVLTFIGKDVFSVFFGPVWAEAGTYAQILSIWALFWFISSPISTVYVIHEKQEFGLNLNIFNFVTRFGSIIIGGYLADPIISLVLFSISGMCINGYLCLKMLDFSNVERSHTIKIIITNILRFIPAGLLLYILIMVGASSIVITITGIGICLIYYLYIIKTDIQIKSLLFSIFPFQKITRIFQRE
jgi:O-antigen/teichoic acid export membrane protein